MVAMGVVLFVISTKLTYILFCISNLVAMVVVELMKTFFSQR